MKAKNSVRATSIGVGFATGLYGISFGALSVAAGLDIWQTQVLSLLMFSGGSQFAFVGVLATGGVSAVPSAVVSAWLLGIRNGFYAIRMAPVLSLRARAVPVASQLTIDESTAVSLAQEDLKRQREGFWTTGIAVFVFWNSLTLLGAFAGTALGKPETYGLDAAAVAAFIALVWPRLRSILESVTAIAALLVSAVSSVWLPVGLPVIVAGLVAVAIANVFHVGKKGDQK
jgi:predicted branched-subunit amino acid permease